METKLSIEFSLKLRLDLFDDQFPYTKVKINFLIFNVLADFSVWENGYNSVNPFLFLKPGITVNSSFVMKIKIKIQNQNKISKRWTHNNK